MKKHEPKAWYMDERFWFNEPGFHQFPKINAIIAEAERRKVKEIRDDIEKRIELLSNGGGYIEQEHARGQLRELEDLLRRPCLKDE